jgi:hypothetical protein
MWEKITRAAHVTMQCRERGGGRKKKNSNVRGACRSPSPVTRFTPTMYVWWWFPHMIPEKFIFWVFFLFYDSGLDLLSYIFMIVIVSRHFLVISFLSLFMCVCYIMENLWDYMASYVFYIFGGSCCFFIELMADTSKIHWHAHVNFRLPCDILLFFFFLSL